MLTILILVRKKNEQDQAYIFHDTYFESHEIYHLTKIYCIEHINHDNSLRFLC